MPKVSLFQNRVLEKLGHKPSQGRYSMLEPDEGKPSRPVLRRGDGSNSVSLDLLYASLLPPIASCNLLLLQSLPYQYATSACQCKEAKRWALCGHSSER